MTHGIGTSGPSRSGDAPRHPAHASFAVVVPMFNEEAGAERCVSEIVRVLDALPNSSALIVVNDGSRDRTADVLGSLRGLARLDVVTHPANRGYGAALTTGAARAAERGFEYVLFMDSDLTNDPADIPRFARLMGEELDVIKGSRYAAGGRMVGVPFRRAMISRAGNVVARVLFRLPVRDCTNGFRAVRTSLLSRMRLRERGFPVIMEELYWCRTLARSYAEVPVTLTNAGRASSFRYTPAVLSAYLRYPLRAFFGIPPNDSPVSRGSE